MTDYKTDEFLIDKSIIVYLSYDARNEIFTWDSMKLLYFFSFEVFE